MPARSHSRHAPARKSSSARSCTAASACSGAGPAATTGCPAGSSSARIASARAATSTAGVLTPTQISAAGSWSRCASLHARGMAVIEFASLHAPGRVRAMSDAPAPRGPRLRELGLRIGTLEPGPENAITDVAGVRGRTRHRLARRARRPRCRAHRRDRDPARARRGALPRAGPGRRGGAQRGGRDDRLRRGLGVGADRDAGLPDLDDGGRTDPGRQPSPRRSPPTRRWGTRTS